MDKKRLTVVPVFAALGALGALTGASGCQAHGAASGSLSAGASLSASGSATASGGASAQAGGKSGVKLSDRVSLVGDKLEYEGEISFKYDSATLQGEGTFTTLGHVRDILKTHPKVKLHIEGHADSRGDDAYNLKLSGARALAIAQWLAQNGVTADRVTSKGYGVDKQKEPARCRDKTGDDAAFKGDDECLAAWSRSRRTVIGVTSGVDSLQNPPENPSNSASSSPAPFADDCRFRIGGRLGLLGPAVHGSIALALQPICLLELNLGLGLKASTGYLFGGEQELRQDLSAIALLARGTFWLLPTHSPVINLSLGASHYEDGWQEFAALGAGYGYRSSGPFRFTLLAGALLPFSSDLGSLPSLFGEASVGALW